MGVVVDSDVGGDVALIGVQPESVDELKRAKRLAELWKVPLLDSSTAPVDLSGVKVIVQPNSLALGFVDRKRGNPYIVDFQGATWRARFQQPVSKQHIFRRALGVTEGPLHIFDATAGFGQDSLMALSMGCKVTAAERSAVVLELLKDGVQRGKEDDVLSAAFSRFTLLCGESADLLKQLKGDKIPDVIFIDPMFDKPKKSAKSPKEMQLLQELVSPTTATEEEELLNVAMSVARMRVVVKRPLKMRALKGATHSYKGQSIRYDVYVSKPKA